MCNKHKTLELVELDKKTSFDEITGYIDRLYLELFEHDEVLTSDVKHKIHQQWQDTNPSHWAYKVLNDGNIVAFFTLVESFSFFAHGQYGIINEFWVAPESRSQGVGGQVLQLIKTLAVQKGWERIDVSAPIAEEWIRSVDFYKKYGLNSTGKKLKYIAE